MTEQELNALFAILARVPLTPPEALWLQALLDRLAQAAQAAVQAKPEPHPGMVPADTPGVKQL